MRILLVEDDAFPKSTLVKVLEENHYIVDQTGDGQVGLNLATTVAYDLILLDVQLPRLDGIRLCHQLRTQGYRKPILLLTASDRDEEVVAGFDAGADDYIQPSCTPDVLLARLRTWLRRSHAMAPAQDVQEATPHLTWGNLGLDRSAGRVTIAGQEVALTATEYNLLELFLCNPDRIFSRSVILDRLWGLAEAPSDRAIVTHIKDLRKKLKAGGLAEEMIETVYGMGYRLKAAPPTLSGQNQRSEFRLAATSAHARVNQVLERFRPVFQQQVGVLEQARTELLAGRLAPELQQAARQEAHKLAGSLASFGYPEGSRLARSIEHLLLEAGSTTADVIIQLPPLVTALQQELTQEPQPVPTLSPVSPSTHRVLVIDDDSALTEQLKAEAQAWGLRLKIAANPAEARSRLSRCPPDVVLLDLSFPQTGEDGLSLLQEMTDQNPDLPVIILTGRDSLTDRLAVSRLGARQFLHKPVSTEQIFRAIERVVAKPVIPEAKVLIVDDDPGVLDLLSQLLTPWGLEVTTVSDPRHFWTVLVATVPNLVLLDLEMPQVNGLELCQVVRQDAQWEDLPLLVVTAHTDAESLQQAFAAGADDFIAKPVLGPELVTRTLSRIERYRLHQKTESATSHRREDQKS